MTDRAENNRVLDANRIMVAVILYMTFNYIFAIGTRLLLVFLEVPSSITKCYGVSLKEDHNGFHWIFIITAIYHLAVTICGLCTDVALHRYT